MSFSCLYPPTPIDPQHPPKGTLATCVWEVRSSFLTVLLGAADYLTLEALYLAKRGMTSKDASAVKAIREIFFKLSLSSFGMSLVGAGEVRSLKRDCFSKCKLLEGACRAAENILKFLWIFTLGFPVKLDGG